MKLQELFTAARELMVKYNLPTETLFVGASLKQYSHTPHIAPALDFQISFFYSDNICDSVQNVNSEILISQMEDKLKTKELISVNAGNQEVEI